MSRFGSTGRLNINARQTGGLGRRAAIRQARGGTFGEQMFAKMQPEAHGGTMPAEIRGPLLPQGFGINQDDFGNMFDSVQAGFSAGLGGFSDTLQTGSEGRHTDRAIEAMMRLAEQLRTGQQRPMQAGGTVNRGFRKFQREEHEDHMPARVHDGEIVAPTEDGVEIIPADEAQQMRRVAEEREIRRSPRFQELQEESQGRVDAGVQEGVAAMDERDRADEFDQRVMHGGRAAPGAMGAMDRFEQGEPPFQILEDPSVPPSAKREIRQRIEAGERPDRRGPQPADPERVDAAQQEMDRAQQERVAEFANEHGVSLEQAQQMMQEQRESRMAERQEAGRRRLAEDRQARVERRAGILESEFGQSPDTTIEGDTPEERMRSAAAVDRRLVGDLMTQRARSRSRGVQRREAEQRQENIEDRMLDIQEQQMRGEQEQGDVVSQAISAMGNARTPEAVDAIIATLSSLFQPDERTGFNELVPQDGSNINAVQANQNALELLTTIATNLSSITGIAGGAFTEKTSPRRVQSVIRDTERTLRQLGQILDQMDPESAAAWANRNMHHFESAWQNFLGIIQFIPGVAAPAWHARSTDAEQLRRRIIEFFEQYVELGAIEDPEEGMTDETTQDEPPPRERRRDPHRFEPEGV